MLDILKYSLNLFKSDMKVVIHSPFVLLVLMVIILIPSLYALVNIDANWDPYSHIDQLKIAVINNDNGYLANGTNVNIGENIVKGLKENKGFKWEFVNYTTGMEGLKTEKYYSMIEIPSNFTTTVYSIEKGKGTERSQIVFWNNEKINPISPRIINSGLDQVQTGINEKISEVIAGIVSTKLHDVGEKAKDNENDFIRIKTRLNQLNYIFNLIEPVLGNPSLTQIIPGEVLDRIENLISLVRIDTMKINSIDYNDLTQLANINTEDVEYYIQSPVTLEKRNLYPVNNYGSSVSPFYICLSLWVGSIVSLAMISDRVQRRAKRSEKVKNESNDKEYSLISVFLGRMGLFITINIFQSLFMATGLILLHLQISSITVFLTTIIYIGLCIITIVYSLISTLGNTGKVIAIVLLVLQIPGSGGVYPIELMPHFFRVITSILPMTYAVKVLREVIAGISWNSYFYNLEILSLVAISAFILAILFKERMNKYSKVFEGKLKESGLF
ncbi:MAG: YhgE/Pip family protein [Methanobrevibacter sp.]|jgi:putative membrane protein|nr:YhgE/Pip family protein [Candidatus Methanovirga basalitermitum]